MLLSNSFMYMTKKPGERHLHSWERMEWLNKLKGHKLGLLFSIS